ncbi:DUF4321 domain-containing protein [Cohnella sp. CFH 77786]|uniref:DUF4321 domain-containing protein n=1 Tax=Cohnella sp. CFH 77786 TaxID=2662265 RepID=UPI001C60FF85|nr:DUF4321 domain-containing protein [Cohnella sp. CFH 77786]MBW5447857.1 DUF4321 domain-containing protein [Cohnella sp. CFH 77786]
MKKNGWILLLFAILGLLAGTLVARWLKDVPGLTFLTRPLPVTLSPEADLAVIRFDLNLHVEFTLLSIAGLAVAIWLYRKM